MLDFQQYLGDLESTDTYKVRELLLRIFSTVYENIIDEYLVSRSQLLNTTLIEGVIEKSELTQELLDLCIDSLSYKILSSVLVTVTVSYSYKVLLMDTDEFYKNLTRALLVYSNKVDRKIMVNTRISNTDYKLDRINYKIWQYLNMTSFKAADDCKLFGFNGDVLAMHYSSFLHAREMYKLNLEEMTDKLLCISFYSIRNFSFLNTINVNRDIIYYLKVDAGEYQLFNESSDNVEKFVVEKISTALGHTESTKIYLCLNLQDLYKEDADNLVKHIDFDKFKQKGVYISINKLLFDV